MSPVCRAVLLLLKSNEVPYEEVFIDLSKGEEDTNELLGAINPNRRVPTMDDNGFGLFESCAILRYLCNKYSLEDHWYPKDIQARSKVEEALDWFPGNLRCGAFRFIGLIPKRTGKPVSDEKRTELTTTLKNSLNMIENYFLKGRKFVGGDNISIADLQFLCEVQQYLMMDKDLCKGRPNMERWIQDCRQYLTPHLDEVNQKVYKIREVGLFVVPLDV